MPANMLIAFEKSNWLLVAYQALSRSLRARGLRSKPPQRPSSGHPTRIWRFPKPLGWTPPDGIDVPLWRC